jgi:hypothetical protein
MATPDETTTDNPPVVTETVTPDPEFDRLSVKIPFPLSKWLTQECDARMVGKAMLVTKALELLRDELPPAP